MDIVVEKITNFLTKKNIKLDTDLFSYGLKGILNYGSMLLIVYAISVFLHTVLLTFVFTVSFLFLRTYCGGFHFERRITCFLFSILFLVFIPFIVRNITFNIMIPILCVLSIIMIYKLSPIEHYNKPISLGERVAYKRKTGIHLLIMIVAIFVFDILHVDEKIIITIEVSMILNFVCMVSTLIKKE